MATLLTPGATGRPGTDPLPSITHKIEMSAEESQSLVSAQPPGRLRSLNPDRFKETAPVINRRRLRPLFGISTAFCASLFMSANAQKLSLAELLHWEPRENLCYGVFVDPPEITATTAPPGIDQAPMSITSDNPTTLSLKGQSTVSGNVTISQPGRLLLANQATFNRNESNQSIDRIELQGNVRYFEHQHALVGQRVVVNPSLREANLWDGAYRMHRESSQQALTIWGTAQKAQNLPKTLNIEQGTYSTCPLCPSPTWQLHANTLSLDKASGVGTAKHVSLHIKQVPILYWPYLSFPIDKRRKSGFLTPTPGHNEQDGFIFEVPYYLNLAPNYDAQITPTWFSNRGIQVGGQFRYLTAHSKGTLRASFLPQDDAFATMRQEELSAENPDPLSAPSLRRLANDSNNRTQISVRHTNDFSPHISTELLGHYVSDDYYLQDFGHSPTDKNSDQLLNQANFRYADNHWDFLSRLQLHQTLHPLNSSAQDTYERLPQIILNGDWLFGKNHPHLLLNSEFVYFNHRRDFMTGAPIVTGQRLDITPGIELPFKNAYAYFTPRFDLEGTTYWLQDQPANSTQNIARFLPITTIDSGLFFERSLFWGHHNITQTVEPRAYYVYIPHTDQNNIPLFDTDLPTFTYQQLFTPNRFSGIDRINDANQITFALTTRFLDQITGHEYLQATLATQAYFQDHQVRLNMRHDSDPLANSHSSPLIGALDYHFSDSWYAIANVVWDPSDQRLTTTNTHLHYQGKGNRLFAIGYDYVRNGDIKVGARSQDLSRLDLAVAIPLSERWQALGNLNYNLSHSHPQFVLAGLEYQSCCFALRAIASHTLIDQTLTDTTTFDNRYYVQINLKGLTTVGNSSPNRVLSDRLPGFYDHF